MNRIHRIDPDDIVTLSLYTTDAAAAAAAEAKAEAAAAREKVGPDR